MTLLTKAVAEVCPIHGMLSRTEPDFKPEATPAQREAAQAIVDGWDWSDAAEAAREAAAHPERTAVRQLVATAIAANATYLAITSPTAVEVRAQVERLTRQVQAIFARIAQL